MNASLAMSSTQGAKSWRRFVILLFVYSAGAVLLVTAAAKLVSAHGTARILENEDPILKISFRRLFELVGTLELIISLICFIPKWLGLRVGLVAWLATSFLVYRIGLKWVGYTKPCSCLGNLTDALHIPPETADKMMRTVLGYLLIGSYVAMLLLWVQNRKAQPLVRSSPPVQA